MKVRLLIAFVASSALMSSCIIADPYYGGHGGRDRGGDYGRPHDEGRNRDDGRYGNDHRRDHEGDRDGEGHRVRDDRRD